MRDYQNVNLPAMKNSWPRPVRRVRNRATWRFKSCHLDPIVAIRMIVRILAEAVEVTRTTTTTTTTEVTIIINVEVLTVIVVEENRIEEVQECVEELRLGLDIGLEAVSVVVIAVSPIHGRDRAREEAQDHLRRLPHRHLRRIGENKKESIDDIDDDHEAGHHRHHQVVRAHKHHHRRWRLQRDYRLVRCQLRDNIMRLYFCEI